MHCDPCIASASQHCCNAKALTTSHPKPHVLFVSRTPCNGSCSYWVVLACGFMQSLHFRQLIRMWQRLTYMYCTLRSQSPVPASAGLVLNGSMLLLLAAGTGAVQQGHPQAALAVACKCSCSRRAQRACTSATGTWGAAATCSGLRRGPGPGCQGGEGQAAGEVSMGGHMKGCPCKLHLCYAGGCCRVITYYHSCRTRGAWSSG